MFTPDRTELKQAQGAPRIQLIKDCQDLLSQPNFTGVDLDRFSENMIALVGGEKEGSLRWSRYILIPKHNIGVAFYRSMDDLGDLTWIEAIPNQLSVRYEDLKAPRISETITWETVGREDDPEITQERFLTGFRLALPKDYDRSRNNGILMHESWPLQEEVEIQLAKTIVSGKQLLGKASYTVPSDRVREICQQSLDEYLPKVPSTRQIYIDSHMAFYRRPR